ncbi:hypothetical protein B0T14DRAFT_340347 [Immersiella caudata]|uniref:WSC domain-containing protein n=1 Tax=Immersiella caudata TaxID=314043 RepID=A0AA39U6G6_9PEZI|nr:hypothetical protein B0T14DRAFT_340347 [Immersiella caudata]
MKSIQLLAAALFAAASVMGQTPTKPSPTEKGVQKPSASPTLNVITVQGCFTDSGELQFNSTPRFNSESSCVQDICFKGGFEVAGTTGGNKCFCGHKYPPKIALTDDKNCNIGCAGFDLQACGGFGTWTIYNTGLAVVVDTSGEETINKGGGGGSGTSTAVKTVTGAPVVVTAPPAESSGGTNVGAIAGGVVVGVLAIAGAIGGMFFYMRRKRNREIEEEHHRNAQVNSFISGKGSSSGGSITDARLDPVMAQRRMSDGSIADNHDYSRKILRVRCPQAISSRFVLTNHRSPMHDRHPPIDDGKRLACILLNISILGVGGCLQLVTRSITRRT